MPYDHDLVQASESKMSNFQVSSGIAESVSSLPANDMPASVSVHAPQSRMRTDEKPAHYAGLKRAFDIAIALGGLIALSPLLITVAVLIKLHDGGSILFRQERGGLKGEPFQIFKFRSMTPMPQNGIVQQAKRDDDRVTPIGKFIRKYSIDELPQLINVLKGDMSIVGPRPHSVTHDRYYSAHIANYNQRFRVKPGITGLAQISGSRGETPRTCDMLRRVRIDNIYADKASIWLDLKIIVGTAMTLLSDDQAY